MKIGASRELRFGAGILGLVFLLGALGILGPAWAAADEPSSVTIDGQWTNPVGSNGTPTCLVSVASGDEEQVRYGDDTWPSDGNCPEDVELQSGLGFTGAGVIPFQSETPFALGEFSHYNRSIQADSTLQGVDLAITLGLGGDSVTLYYTFGLNETDNVQCLPQGASPCADVADIVTTTPDQTFVIGNMEYTLEILGFGDPADPNSITNQITTDENAVTMVSLVGRFVPVGLVSIADPSPPIPGAPALILMGLGIVALGGALWYGRRGAFPAEP